MTSYMTMVDGPTKVIYKDENGRHVETDRKQYVILLDNGRLEAAKDPVLQQGFPVCTLCFLLELFAQSGLWVGGHVYGHIYSGGIGAYSYRLVPTV